MLGRLLAVCLGVVVGCYSPSQPDCGFVCGPGGACPEGYACASNDRCVRTGVSSTACPDAGIDSAIIPPGDIGLDAFEDTTLPEVSSTVPAASTTGVARNSTITIVFSEDVVNVTDQTFTVTGVQPVLGAVSTTDPATYVFTPTADYLPNQTITVTLTNAIADLAGNALVMVTFDFQTGTL